MLTYNLNERGNTPLYDYLYQCIRQDIIAGNLSRGQKLPSKRALAHHLNVGLITVANAYAQLTTEGYVKAVEKKGYFVEDVSHYVQRKPDIFKKSGAAAVSTETVGELMQTGSACQVRDFPEKEYFADFRANRISLKNFPMATWTRLVRESLTMQNESLFKTVPFNGLLELRSAIAEYLYTNRGMTVYPSQIIIGAGTEYLYSRLLQLFGRSSTFAMEDPGYKKFASIAGIFGNAWKYIPIDENGLLVNELEKSGAQIVHLSPANHFPTGIVMPITRRLELFEWANRKPGRYIIEDDYDSEFRYNGKFILPLYAEDTQNKVIYMNTFSKTLVPSLRISYMVLPEKLMEEYKKAQSFYSCTVSSFEQHTLARFISQGYFERHLNRMKKYYREQRALILQTIKDSPLAKMSRVIERNAGTHFLLELQTELTEKQVREAARQENLCLSFYSDYGHASAVGENCTLVINYAGISRENVGEVIDRLTKIFPECR